MAIHSCILAWRIPWTEKPSRLQSTESQSRIRLSDFTFTFSGFEDLIPLWSKGRGQGGESPGGQEGCRLAPPCIAGGNFPEEPGPAG